MRALSREEQIKMLGGSAHENVIYTGDTYIADCVKCDTFWAGTTRSDVQSLAYKHYLKKGGAAGGHRYRWISD